MAMLIAAGVPLGAQAFESVGFLPLGAYQDQALPGPCDVDTIADIRAKAFHDLVTALWSLRGREFVEAYLDALDVRIAIVVKPFAKLFDAGDHSVPCDFGAKEDAGFKPSWLNPFMAYEAAQGFSAGGIWLPDLREAEATSTMKAAHGVQHGSHLKTGGSPRYLGPRPCSEGASCRCFALRFSGAARRFHVL